MLLTYVVAPRRLFQRLIAVASAADQRQVPPKPLPRWAPGRRRALTATKPARRHAEKWRDLGRAARSPTMRRALQARPEILAENGSPKPRDERRTMRRFAGRQPGTHDERGGRGVPQQPRVSFTCHGNKS